MCGCLRCLLLIYIYILIGIPELRITSLVHAWSLPFIIALDESFCIQAMKMPASWRKSSREMDNSITVPSLTLFSRKVRLAGTRREF